MPLPSWTDGDALTTGDAYTYINGLAAVAVAVAVTTGKQLIAPQTWTGLICAASEDVDTDGIHSLATAQNWFTPTIPGYYVIKGWAEFAASSAGNYRQAAALKNAGTSTFYGFQRSMDLSASIATMVEVTSVPIACNGTTDFIEIACGHDATEALTMGVSRVGVYRLRGL